MAEDTLTYARVLAERPPLQRLLAEPGREGLVPFLRRFCETSELDACAVFDGAQVVASSGKALPWAAMLHRSRRSRASVSWRCRRGTQYSVIGAVAKLPAQYSSFSVMVVHLLDDRLADDALGAQRPAGAAHQLPRLQRAARRRIHFAAFAGADRRALRRAAHRQPGTVRIQLSGVLVERRGHRAHRNARLGHGNRRVGERAGVAADPHRLRVRRRWR